MRKIKFRGKRVDNGEWIYGDLHQGFITGNAYINGNAVIRLDREIHPETVGQYTGLKDKNGVEIYEGDILRNVDNPFVDKLPAKEVIGNIYDNPELMEGE